MAFPTASAATTTNFSTSVTSMAVGLPASIASGDLLIATVMTRNYGTGVWSTIPSGWSTLFGIQANSTGAFVTFYKVATGSEGSSATWVFNTTTTAAWQVRKVTGWHGSTTPEYATFSSTGTIGASLANPPSVTPSWGAADTLWLAVMGDTAQAVSITAAPTNYSDFTTNTGGSTSSTAQVASGTRQLNATSEDPGAFTTGSDRWYAAATIAIRPVAVTYHSSFRFYPRSGCTSRVTGGKVQGSTDGYTWTDLTTLTTPTDNAWNVVNMTATLTDYKYVRYLSPNSGYGNIAEIEFYDGVYGSGGTKITPTSTVASYYGGSNPYTNVFDGNTSTFYETPTGDGQWVGIGVAAFQSSMRYYPRSGWTSRMIGGKFQGSTDGSTWTDLTAAMTEPIDGRWAIIDSLYDLNDYRYLRYLSPNGGYGNIAEVEFYKNGTYSTTGTKVADTVKIANYTGGSNPYTNAFDGDTSTFYEGNGGDNQYVGIDQGSAAASGEISVNIGGAFTAKPIKVNGVAVKLYYYNKATDDWIEVVY